MGTRADFYVGTGPTAEWLGSITYDGYPTGTPRPVFAATDEPSFRAAVETMLAALDINERTRPAEGWPWPWEDSRLTDYAYAFTADGVKVSAFGSAWTLNVDDDRDEERGPKLRDDEVVDMSDRTMASDALMAKSGLIITRGSRTTGE